MKLGLKDIIILVFLALFTLLIIFRGDTAEWLGYTDDVIIQEREVIIDLTEGIKDSLALIPVYQARLDFLSSALEGERRRLSDIRAELALLNADIEDNTVEEDIEFFVEQVDGDTMPEIIWRDNGIWVAIIPSYLKQVNHIFAGYNSQLKEISSLRGQLDNLEEQNGTLVRQAGTLRGAIDLCNERHEVSEGVISLQAEQIKKLKRSSRWQKVGIFGGVVIGFGAAFLIFSN